MRLPSTLHYKSKNTPQVTQRNDCYWLGQLKGMEWGLINEARPADGVELYASYPQRIHCLSALI